MRGVYKAVLGIAIVALVAHPAQGQTATYHLHNQLSNNIFSHRQMRTDGPAPTTVVIQSADLKNATGTASVDLFDTLSNVPNVSGTIPALTTVSATVWMKKTANYGVFRPNFTLYTNSTFPQYGTLIATCVGTTAINQVLQPYVVSCQTQYAVPISPTDRYLLVVGVNIDTSTNHSVKIELDIEGSTDSRLVAPLPPPPSITSLTPASGPVNWSVAIAGVNFGDSQGTSTVKFNTTTATQVSNWSNLSITALVPAGAGSGPVTVTVNGAQSNTDKTFAVIPPPTLTSVMPTLAHRTDAVTITGNNFLGSQYSSTVTFNGTGATNITSWSNTSIGAQVPVGATTGNVVVTVSNQASNGVSFTVIPPPAISMTTPSSGLAGASVTIVGTNFGASQGSNTVKFNGTTTTPASWSDTAIVAPIPPGATTGNVVITVSNQASNGLPFTVLVGGTLAGNITRATGGTAISGATVQAVLAGVVKGTATTGTNGTYSISNLDPATTWDVRVFASGFSSELRQGVTVSSSTTTTLDTAMYVPGTVSGKVTQLDGITPLMGAAVTVYTGPSQKGSASTNGTGDYTITGLHPGAYTVQAAEAGYRTVEQGATVSESATTTSNLSLPLAATGPVGYVYDELGRLVQVTDPSGEAAIYRYDPVGNLTSIVRPGATGVAISAFSPITGAVGTIVTIDGTGFSATPGANSVSFNGTPSTVTSATATHLITTVPAGLPSATYTIGVTSPTGSAAKDGFVVTAASGAPTITSFTPSLAASGTALTVNGTNFETTPANDNLRLNLAPAQIGSATTTAIQATVSPTATTGHVAVATPNGTATTATYLWIPPPGYLVSKVESTIPVTLGSDTPVEMSTAGNFALLAFDGLEGHRAAVGITGVNGDISNQTWVSLFDPLGGLMRFAPVVDGGFLDTVALRSTATYSLVFAPAGTPTMGHLVVYDVPPDFTSPIGFGDANAVSVSTTVPGQNGLVTFTGTENQRVALNQTGFNCLSSWTTIKRPSLNGQDGTILAQSCGGYFIDTVTLDVPGTNTYSILVDPTSTAFGSTTLTLYNVPADSTVASSVGGAAVLLPMESIGQNGIVTFTGTPGQQATVHVTGNTVTTSLTARLYSTNLSTGVVTELTAVVGVWPQFDLSPVTLPPNASYKIVFDPNGMGTGHVTVSITTP